MHPFRTVSVKNRLGEAIDVLIHPLKISAEHTCVLLTLPKNTHASMFAKNAEYIAHQLRQTYQALAQGFSLVEIRKEKEKSEVWYDWKFSWVGDTPVDSQFSALSLQKKSYLSDLFKDSLIA